MAKRVSCGIDYGTPGGDVTAFVKVYAGKILSMKYITMPPEKDGAGLLIRLHFSLGGRKGPVLHRIMTTPEPGAVATVPDYIPDEWLNRLRLEIDAAGQPHFLWTGWNNGEGHGKFKEDGKARYTHRAVVEKVERRTLTRLDYVDHKAEICGRKACCNYDHLETVPPGVNTARGHGAANQFRKAAEYNAEMYREHYYGDPLDAL